MQGRDRAVQHVVSAIEMPCFFDRRNVRGFLNHTDQPLITGGTAAVGARVDIGDVIANGTQPEVRFDITYGARQRFRVGIAGAQDVKGQPLSALASDSRELL